jgi:hypothetical protein
MNNLVLNGNPVSLPEHMRQIKITEAPTGELVYVPGGSLRVDENFGLWLHPDASFYYESELLEEEEYIPVIAQSEGFEVWLALDDQFTVDSLTDFSSLLPVIRLTLTSS